MPQKRPRFYWILNIFAALMLFGWLNIYLATLLIRVHGSAPQGFGLLKGSLWPLEFVVSGGFTFSFFAAVTLAGAATAIRYRSRWGLIMASAAGTLLLLHVLAMACHG